MDNSKTYHNQAFWILHEAPNLRIVTASRHNQHKVMQGIQPATKMEPGMYVSTTHPDIRPNHTDICPNQLDTFFGWHNFRGIFVGINEFFYVVSISTEKLLLEFMNAFSSLLWDRLVLNWATQISHPTFFSNASELRRQWITPQKYSINSEFEIFHLYLWEDYCIETGEVACNDKNSEKSCMPSCSNNCSNPRNTSFLGTIPQDLTKIALLLNLQTL